MHEKLIKLQSSRWSDFIGTVPCSSLYGLVISVMVEGIFLLMGTSPILPKHILRHTLMVMP